MTHLWYQHQFCIRNTLSSLRTSHFINEVILFSMYYQRWLIHFFVTTQVVKLAISSRF